MKNFILILCVFVFSAQSNAGGAITAKVIQVRVDASGKGMVVFDQPIGGTPASCAHTSYKNALAFDTNTAGGKSILSLALVLKTTNASVAAYGTGLCGIFNGSWVEDWDYGILL